MGNFILVDREFELLADQVNRYCTNLESGLNQYYDILQTIAGSAIASGATHDAILCFNNYVKGAQEAAAGIGGKFASLTSSFISEVDAADSYLYETGLSSVRDFSDAEFAKLMDCLDDPWCPLTDNFGDWLGSLIMKVIDIFDLDLVKSLLMKCHTFLLDYNDETAAGLRVMFEAVNGIDQKYGQATCFGYAVIALSDVRDMLKEMASIIGGGSAFTVDSINGRLGGLFAAMLESVGKFINVPEFKGEVSIEKISDFASQPWAEWYFSGFSKATIMFVSDLGGVDAAMMVIFQMFDIGKTSLVHGNYNDYIIKSELLDLLDQVADNKNVYKDTGSDEELSDLKDFIKLAKKGGKAYYDFMNSHRLPNGKLILDGRTVEAKELKEQIDGFDKAGDILKYGEAGVDYVARLLADYSDGLEVIASFEQNLPAGSEMQKSVEEVKALYNKEFGAWAEEALGIIGEFGVDAAMDKLAEANPVGAVVKGIEKGIDLTGEMTGLGDQAKSTYTALVRYNMSTETEAAYRSALEKFQQADPSSEDYEQLAEDVSHCFDLHKNNMVNMFEEMANASEGTKKSYYRYCEMQARNLSMNDSQQPEILSYEEYLSIYDSGSGGGAGVSFNGGGGGGGGGGSMDRF